MDPDPGSQRAEQHPACRRHSLGHEVPGSVSASGH